MATLPELRSLYDRVCKADGPDRELDRDIAKVVLGRSIGVAKYTASLDAITALIERELPGWEWQVRKTGYAELHHPTERLKDVVGYCESPALALTAAFLAACIAKREAGNAD